MINSNSGPESGSEINKREYWNTKTVLIVEDSDLSSIYYETALQSAGINVLCTMDGHEAIEICREGKVDLVLLDLYLPKINGFEIVQEIRKFNTDLPVIAQTSYNDKDEYDLSISSGCNEFITKPIRLEDLLNLINKYIG